MFPLCITLSPSLALASHQRGSKQNLWGMHREKEERRSFVSSDADSAQHWLCATALSRVSTQRESVFLQKCSQGKGSARMADQEEDSTGLLDRTCPSVQVWPKGDAST